MALHRVNEMDIVKNSVPYNLIIKMNEAKIMRGKWLELYEEIDRLVKQLTPDGIKLLLKYIPDRILNDIITCGLAEWWAESMDYYDVLDVDGEMPKQSEENQNSWYYESMCGEVELQDR